MDATRCEAGVCLPATLLPLPSWKYQVMSVFDFQTSTATGVGWAMIDIRTAATTAANSIYYTVAGYLGGSGTGFAKSGTGINAATMMSPNTLAITNINEVRLVAISMVIEPTTPGLNRGGSLFGFTEPNHQDIVTGLFTPNTVLSAPSCTFQGFGTETVRFLVNSGPPVNPAELEFTSSAGPVTCMVAVAISSAPQSFHVKVVGHYEAIQVTASPTRTISHADPAGAGAVGSAVANAIHGSGQDPHGSRPFIQRAINFLGQAVAVALPAVGQAIRAAAPVAGMVVRAITQRPRTGIPRAPPMPPRRIGTQSNTNRRLQRALPASRTGRAN